MKINHIILFLSFIPFCLFADIMQVSESEMPELSNESAPFRGKINHTGYLGHTWVGYPHVENPASLGIDPTGAIIVAEAHRFKYGVPDLRSNRHMIQDDFKSRTVEDRLKMYQKHQNIKPMEWYTDFPERLIRLEDRDGNTVADHRLLFSDDFDDALDGIGFSILAERDAVYFTCIPALRKLSDSDLDGVADTHQKIVEGFGVRVSFTGHDLHGIIRGPDGRLYFSVGDRGFSVESKEGNTFEASGRGAVFRCDSDGSNFEVYATGLRNPQELAFDDYGNLFTFDNNGDIGDKSRVVYVLDNSDSGWDMAHQSHHQYVKDLDWGDYHIKKSVWVGENMFGLYDADSPQWVYPPVAHAGNGPSGVTWLTGLSVPSDLRNSFLLTDYRGASTKCQTLTIRLKSAGSGFELSSMEPLVEGLAASDVELGFDGNLYFADYGGGWSANRNGTIQVLRPTDKEAILHGAETARMFKKGFLDRSKIELSSLLKSKDRRIRQEAQFALVAQGASSIPIFEELLSEEKFEISQLHAIWGLGQLFRNGILQSRELLLQALESPHLEIRANVARTIGDIGMKKAKSSLIKTLSDKSSRVRSMGAIALGRVADAGDTEACIALFNAVARNQGPNFEVTLRHAYLSALSRLSTKDQLVSYTGVKPFEQRMTSVLLLRRMGDENLSLFLDDSDEYIRHEAIRAIYDTNALTTSAGEKLLDLAVKDYPYFIQTRIISAAHRLQNNSGANLLIEVAMDTSLDDEVRTFALRAIQSWMKPPQFDAVLGHFRPVEIPGNQISALLSTDQKSDFQQFLSKEKNPSLVSLGTDVAQVLGIVLNSDLLRQQIRQNELSVLVRLSCMENLSNLGIQKDNNLFLNLLDDDEEEIRAFALKECFERKLDGIKKVGLSAVKNEALPVAREAIRQLSKTAYNEILDFWLNRIDSIRPELWLDLYSAMQTSDSPDLNNAAMLFSGSDLNAVHSLTLQGGNPKNGESVFRNQGACLQCHKISGEGGVQGPELSLVADRLSSEKLLESIVNPSAEITPGYGLSSVSLNTGNNLAGRIAAEENDEILLITPDGTNHSLNRSQIESISPPVSAMPPVGLALNPNDLRDLVAYLGSRNKKSLNELKRKAAHGKN